MSDESSLSEGETYSGEDNESELSGHTRQRSRSRGRRRRRFRRSRWTCGKCCRQCWSFWGVHVVLAALFPPYGYYCFLRKTLFRCSPCATILCAMPLFYSLAMMTLIASGATIMFLTHGNGIENLLKVIRTSEKELTAILTAYQVERSTWALPLFATTGFLRTVLSGLGGALAYTGGHYTLVDIALYSHVVTISVLKFCLRLLDGFGNAIIGYDVD